MSDKIECPNCGSDSNLIPVWEGMADYKIGTAPDYIGCTECNQMSELDSSGVRQDER